MSKSYNEGYKQGFKDVIKVIFEEVGEQDYDKGDGKMTRRHLPEVKKIPKQKSNYKPKWG